MVLFVAGIIIMAFSGLPPLLMKNEGRSGETLSEVLALCGAALAFAASLIPLLSDTPATLAADWTLPGGEVLLRIDALSLIFLCPLLIVFAMTVIYGRDYWPQPSHPQNSRKLRLFHGVIAAAMALVFTAQNGILFLVTWEIMALSSYFLITTEDDHEETRSAGFIYLVATHTGTLLLFALFALLEVESGSFTLPAAGTLLFSSLSSTIFLLALGGFGLKAGIMPLHIWLPGAHAAAPSHISALLSGIMIKTGIYGLLRVTSFFASVPLWWGWLLIVLGAITGILGVAYALAQHDLKRLLAYHSVENIGIITMGLGLALVGRSLSLPELTALALGGAMLHVINHGLFKALLFLSAGTVIHAAGSRDMEKMGGYIRSQPWSAVLFLCGAVAICGLPPFNGFISEWLIYQGSFHALADLRLSVSSTIIIAPILALIGGLALACFVKVFGIVFLGSPRRQAAAGSHDATVAMRGAMLTLAVSCLIIGLCPWAIAPLLKETLIIWNPVNSGAAISQTIPSLTALSLCGAVLILGCATLAIWLHRRSLRDAAAGETWGCGFQQPTARMQYTASSFADFLVRLLRFGLWTSEEGGESRGLFPRTAHYVSHTVDVVLDRLLQPLLSRVAIIATLLRSWLQNGITSLYLLYVVMTLITLLLMSVR